MENLKDFFNRICAVENVTVKELQELTGKSKSVVYQWFNNSNLGSFPSYDSLSKILCRLGITMDELLSCKCNKLVNSEKYRTYKHYFYTELGNVIISHRVVEAVDYENILNCFIFDMLEFKKMLRAYLNKELIDLEKFDVLCLNLQPYFFSEIEIDELGGGTCYYLNSSYLADYKYRCERYDELLKEDPIEALKINHKLSLPNANDFVLFVATTNFDMLKKYVFILDENEKSELMYRYLVSCYNNKKFDKKRRIFKYLTKRNCMFIYDIEKLADIYNKLLEEVKK